MNNKQAEEIMDIIKEAAMEAARRTGVFDPEEIEEIFNDIHDRKFLKECGIENKKDLTP